MDLSRALSRGIRFGANVGAVIAIMGLFGAPLLGANFLSMLGVSEMIGLAASASPQGIIPMVAETIAGALVGGAVGGATFATTHTLTHAIPGMRTLTGEPARKRKKDRVEEMEQELGRSLTRAEERALSEQRGSNLEGDITESRRDGKFVRNLELQQIRQEQMEEALGR